MRNLMQQLAERASKFAPSECLTVTMEEKAGHLAAQNLAFAACHEVRALLQEGWTEVQAARFLETYLRDQGVSAFFHRAFVWYGENTRFRNVKRYKDFMSSKRRLKEGEAVIFDVAPVYRGYTCDIGYSFCFGKNPEYDKATAFLHKLRAEIPALFTSGKSGAEIWGVVDEEIRSAGYDNIHALYPMSVLGHRVHRASEHFSHLQILNFEWTAYWNLLSRGVFSQLLAPFYSGKLHGLWAVEPHIGTKKFGLKFEELLVVDDNGARWLAEEK